MTRVADTAALDAVPDELADAVRCAAAALPGYPGDLAAVGRRASLRRRRRSAGTAAACAALVVASIAVPYALTRDTAAATLLPAVPAQTASPAPPPPAQRLFLSWYGGITLPGTGGEDGVELVEPDRAKPNFGYPANALGVVSVGGLNELRPDGRVVTHRLDRSGGDYGWVFLDDGRLVTANSHDLAPGKPRTDGPCVSDLEILLQVREPSGAVSLSRDIRQMCRQVYLVGATPEEAYLIRGDATRTGSPRPGAELVAHRFVDAAERVVVANLDALGGTIDDLSLNAGLAAAMVYGTSGSDCGLVVLSLATAEVVADIDLRPSAARDQTVFCGRVRLSPDGRLAAATTEVITGQGPGAIREGTVRVFDLATGAMRAEQRLYTDTFGVAVLHKGIGGIAWADDQTLMVGLVEPPREQTRIYAVDELRGS